MNYVQKKPSRMRDSLVVECLLANQKVPIRYHDGSYSEATHFHQAFFMHLTPGLVHNLHSAESVQSCCPQCSEMSHIPM